MPGPLTEERLDYELRGLQGWAYADGRIMREFTFADGVGARAFASAAGELIGAHPAELEVSVDPGLVRVALCSAGDGVTHDDIEVAHRLDALVGKT
ncbi:MAG: 4a-hydroxytetrahydrobiopterin dehydratase [Dehalococcoidia bacterium]